ncbi:MAG: hypothetical protein HGA22_12285, partial [Clostridiales bacterium]|nr:hypothetical protein [Clostridiales bacterium]
RLEGDYESIVICRCSEGNDEAVIDEAELMEIINEKCMAKEQLYASQIKNSKKTGD